MLDAMLQDIVEILYTSLKQPSYEDMVSLNSSEKQLNGTLDTTVPKSRAFVWLMMIKIGFLPES